MNTPLSSKTNTVSNQPYKYQGLASAFVDEPHGLGHIPSQYEIWIKDNNKWHKAIGGPYIDFDSTNVYDIGLVSLGNEEVRIEASTNLGQFIEEAGDGRKGVLSLDRPYTWTAKQTFVGEASFLERAAIENESSTDPSVLKIKSERSLTNQTNARIQAFESSNEIGRIQMNTGVRPGLGGSMTFLTTDSAGNLQTNMVLSEKGNIESIKSIRSQSFSFIEGNVSLPSGSLGNVFPMSEITSSGIYLVTVSRGFTGASFGTNGVYIVGLSVGGTGTVYASLNESSISNATISGGFFRVQSAFADTFRYSVLPLSAGPVNN